MEEIKALEEVLKSDQRWLSFEMQNHPEKDLENWYCEIAAIPLSNQVPEEIRSQFNIASMLAIYTWLYYPLHQISELKAFSTVEAALRSRFPECHRKSFKKLIQFALERGYVSSSSAIQPYQLMQLPDYIADRRNDLAHGSTTLIPHSKGTLELCADIINQLYPPQE